MQVGEGQSELLAEMNEVNITSGLLYFNVADHAFARYRQRNCVLGAAGLPIAPPPIRTALKRPRGGAALA
jgi:hypothetical protein